MMGLASEEADICPFHENVDPNERYELIQLLGEGSYGSVYKGGTYGYILFGGVGPLIDP